MSAGALLNPAEVRRLLDAHGLHPSRALGQNFLTDPNTARRITRLAGVTPGMRILEIGPGLGSLTLALADATGPGGEVVALELDRHLLAPLAEVVGDRPNVRIVGGDALAVDYDALLGAGETWAVVANLPYNIATPLLARLLEEVSYLDPIVVMVQKEVADRLGALPGARGCGSISVKVAYHASAKRLAVVPPTVFHPRPRVDSAIVAFTRRSVPPVEVPSPATLFDLARAGFGQRRKTLRQALKVMLGARGPEVFNAAGVDAGARAETLTLEEWAALARAMSISRRVPSLAPHPPSPPAPIGFGAPTPAPPENGAPTPSGPSVT